MCNWTSPRYGFAVSRTTHLHTHFWQVHLFKFQYKCIRGYFISYQDKKHNLICCLKYTGNFFLYISMNQSNLAESFLKIAVYLTFPYPTPYKILLVYLPEMSVRMTYPSHPRKTRNTLSCTSVYP